MPSLTELVRSARTFTYAVWRRVASSIVWMLILCALLGSFLAASDTVQSFEYGVAALILVLCLVLWTLFDLFDVIPDLRPTGYSGDKVGGAKKLALVSVVVVPIGISWTMNESLLGALNPIGYWSEELTRINESDCTFFRDMLNRSAENFRVTQNKYDMGIATVFEVKHAAESLELAQGMQKDCFTAAEKRQTVVRKRLTDLRKG